VEEGYRIMVLNLSWIAQMAQNEGEWAVLISTQKPPKKKGFLTPMEKHEQVKSRDPVANLKVSHLSKLYEVYTN
jgi:hypothetical protein